MLSNIHVRNLNNIPPHSIFPRQIVIYVTIQLSVDFKIIMKCLNFSLFMAESYLRKIWGTVFAGIVTFAILGPLNPYSNSVCGALCLQEVELLRFS